MAFIGLSSGEKVARRAQMDKTWVINLRDQCEDAGVPFFFKQWGGVRKSERGRELEGRTYDEMPERKPLRVPTHKERLAMINEVQGWETAEDSSEANTAPIERMSLLF